jgi:BRCA1-associated protein
MATSSTTYATVIETETDERDEDDDGETTCRVVYATSSSDGGPSRSVAAKVRRGKIRLFRRASSERLTTTTDDDDASRRPVGRGNDVCVLGVPSTVSVADFCRFAAGVMEKTRAMRVVASSKANAESGDDDNDDDDDDDDDARFRSTYDVLLTFDSVSSADVFVDDYYGRKYANGRPETCVALYVDSIETNADALDPSTTTEVPTCPVCLDRLDEEVSGILTTICNHSFHAECLSGWADASCPVCRYAHEPNRAPRCAACGKEHDLWVCLICGEVRCGRYAGACAVEHWKETNHCYSLEVGTQRVWDYVSDGFVHRIIQSKSGLVELTPPRQRRASSSSNGCEREHCSPGRAPDVEDMDSELEEALVASKLDAIASEYDVLLTSQLESQRKHFENLLQTAHARADGVISRQDEESRNAAVIARAMKEAQEAKHELKRVQKLNASQSKTIGELEEEISHLKILSDTLEENVGAFKSENEKLTKRKEIELSLKDARIRELEEANRDLMLFLDASNKLSADEDVAGGTVVGIDREGKPRDEDEARNPTHERLREKLKSRK